MKISRRSLLSLLPVLPANFFLSETVNSHFAPQRKYVAKLVENAFGKFSEQQVVTAFIETVIQDQALVQKICRIETYSALEISEIDCRIAELFIIKTNYLEIREGKHSALKLRNYQEMSKKLADYSARDPAFWTQI
jgi:hypothetical protein